MKIVKKIAVEDAVLAAGRDIVHFVLRKKKEAESLTRFLTRRHDGDLGV
jgi:hypothetical protein